MSNVSILNKEKNYFNRKRLINKNKEEFKSELLDYARSNFPDKISDFSEASLGGMLLDFAAIVGESLTFYIDQQINELDYENASTEFSISNHLRKANVNVGFASPSSVLVDFYLLVSKDASDDTKPNSDYLPVIKRETQLRSDDGITFNLEENIDFSSGCEIIREVVSGNESFYLIKKSGICTSGEIINESFAFDDNTTEDFLSYTFSNENITKIIKVSDGSSDLNEYKEVEFLSQDTVYEKVILDSTSYISISPAAFRYTLERDFENGLTTIRFGNNKNNINEDGILTNPEELSMPLLSRDYMTNFSLDPKKLIGSKSLGVSPAGKILNVKYKFGGGSDHNVQSRSINTIDNVIYSFPRLISEDTDSITVINSLSVLNEENAVGGSNALSLEELKDQIKPSMKMQSRIVNHEDLLARLYSMPSDFGRISKASILDNPYSKAAKDLYVICKNNQNHYENANDALKYNISKYLNEYRLIGDSFNIINAEIYNFSIYLKIKVSNNYDQQDVITEVQSKIFTLMRFEKLQIGEPINVNKIVKIALDTPGVLTISSNFKTIIRPVNNDTIDRVNLLDSNKIYNDNSFSVFDRYDNGIMIPPKGGIFQLKYPSDIEVVSG